MKTLLACLLLGGAFAFAAGSAPAPTDAPAAVRARPHTTPAWSAAARFRRGVNCANYLEVPPGQTWAMAHSPADLRQMRAEGFDHVRIPIGWHHYTGPGPEFQISDSIYGKVDDLVTNATAIGLNVIINIHHFDPFTTDPAANTPKFLAIWRQVAAHYAHAPAGVAFELLNEPKDAAKTEVINPIWEQAIKEIRRTNPGRAIFLGPGFWNSVNELPKLRLPEEDQNLIVTVHCYEPFYFTHQGASWGGPDVRVTGIQFPGPPEQPLEIPANVDASAHSRDWVGRYNTQPAGKNPSGPQTFGALIQKAKAWSEAQGRPVHFGEFGCYMKADPASRARFYSAFRQALDDADMGWAVWDWKSGFNYWDPKAGRPEPGLRAALFPGK